MLTCILSYLTIKSSQLFKGLLGIRSPPWGRKCIPKSIPQQAMRSAPGAEGKARGTPLRDPGVILDSSLPGGLDEGGSSLCTGEDTGFRITDF